MSKSFTSVRRISVDDGAAIKAFRNSRRVRVPSIAKATGISPYVLYEIERGDRPASKEELDGIVAAIEGLTEHAA